MPSKSSILSALITASSPAVLSMWSCQNVLVWLRKMVLARHNCTQNTRKRRSNDISWVLLLHINNFGAISFLVLNDPFEEGVGEKTWEKKSRAWCCFCLLESGQKRLLPILTLGFLLGEILPKVGIFFSLFFLFFFCWKWRLKKKKCFPGFLVTRFQKRNFNFHIFVISSGRVAKQ